MIWIILGAIYVVSVFGMRKSIRNTECSYSAIDVVICFIPLLNTLLGIIVWLSRTDAKWFFGKK